MTLAPLLVLAAAALLLALWPLLRRTDGDDATATPRDVYRAQLDDLDAELARGAMSTEQAAELRAELGRRFLAATKDGERINQSGGPRRTLALALAGVLLAGSAAVYAWRGHPNLAGAPLASRPDLPQTAEGWMTLGRSLLDREAFAGATEAFARAARLAPEDPETHVAYGEARFMSAGEKMGPEAQFAFERALELSPRHPAARYYLALAAAQAGDWRGAFDAWRSLADDSRPDAPWLPALAERLREAAAELGVAAPELNVVPPPPRTAAEEIARLPPDQRQAMVRSMVEGLEARMAENPADYQGWMRLGRAWSVLGEPERARAAYAGALRARPGDAEAQQALETLR